MLSLTSNQNIRHSPDVAVRCACYADLQWSRKVESDEMFVTASLQYQGDTVHISVNDSDTRNASQLQVHKYLSSNSQVKKKIIK